MHQRTTGIATALLLLLTPIASWAKPRLEVGIAATKQVVVVQGGKRVTKVVAAKSAEAGQALTYTVTYTNKGDEHATKAVIADPIPTGATYVANSATGPGSEINFSIDGGKTFARPEALLVDREVAGKREKLVATADRYTHVRWTVDSIPPGATGQLSFKVKIK